MNLGRFIAESFAEEYGRRVALGVVTGTSGNRVLVRLSDSAAADSQAYARLSSYSSPTNGDEVLMLKVGNPPAWLCIGKVLR